ncbi:MAG TPA: T9SS type A sorting domain-containing protein [Brumimicrobium sp.]|nr:T9SS type A sorting domain-containing protein [Brumimicrobium sp.]
MTVVTLKNSPKISLQSLTNTVCNDNLGEIKTSVDSPNGSYNGYWSNGAQNINTISSLTAGDYYQTVIDQIGCKDQIAVVVETDGFEISGNVSHVKCKGGSDGEIDINISSGSGNYKIIWSSGQSTTSVSGLSAGTYSVKVTDLDNGCESYKNFVVEEPLEEVLAYYINNRPSTCSASDGEIIDVNIINGNPPYSFIWSNGETTEEISGLSSGHYSVEITDWLGCKATYKTNLNALGAPNAFPKLTNPSCGESNGAIQLIEVYPKFGEEVIGYLWSNGMETRNINNLNAGVYTITLKQSDGCNGIYSYELKDKPYNYAPEICIVSVDTATNTNLVVWEKEHGNPNDIAHYNIYRANSTTGEYQNVGLVDYTSISVFNDVVVSPERRSWQYKISAVNSCGQESRLSQHHKTIHLVMNDGQFQGEKTLTWDHYEGLEYFHYNIYRGTNFGGWHLLESGIPITALPNYSDTIPLGVTEVDYIIEVVPSDGGCSPSYIKAQDYNSSRSNKPSPIFDFGNGTDDIETSNVTTYTNDKFKAVVYPNPSDGCFNIEITDNINNEILNMTVLNMNGKTIHQQSLSNDLNVLRFDVDAGIYFVKIQGESILETIKIIVQ